MKIRTMNLPLVLALAAAISASPALAQGKGKGNGRGNDRPRTEVRDDRRGGDDDWDDDDDRRERLERESRRLERRDGRSVPPGWCQGRGNPHNTRENCGSSSSRDRRRTDDRPWYDRVGDSDRRRTTDDRPWYERVLSGDRNTRTSRSVSGSYDSRHRAFHDQLRRECQSRTSGAGTIRAIAIERECSAQHDAWHRREGRRHN